MHKEEKQKRLTDSQLNRQRLYMAASSYPSSYKRHGYQQPINLIPNKCYSSISRTSSSSFSPQGSHPIMFTSIVGRGTFVEYCASYAPPVP